MAAHIQRLPVEIIAHVLFFVRVSGGGYDSDSLKSLVSTSAVCSRWNAIVVSSPRLWTFVDCGRSSEVEPFGSVFARVQLHLQRSGAASIDLYFSSDRGLDLSTEEIGDLWRLVTPHLHRARSLVFFSLTHELGIMFPILGAGQLQRLEKLEVIKYEPLLMLEYPFGDEDVTPNLRELRFWNIDFAPVAIMSVTRLTLDHSSPKIWSYVLASLEPFPNLEHVALHFVIEDDDESLQPLVLPNLTSLFLRDCAYQRYLVTPKLEYLACEMYTGQADLAPLFPLQRLAVHRPTTEAMERWSSSTSGLSLRRLDLDCCHPDAPLDLLMLRSGAANTLSALPLLRKLSVTRNHRPRSRKTDYISKLFDLLDARPELSIACDDWSLETPDDWLLETPKPIDWPELHRRSGGRLSKLDDSTLPGWS